MREELDIEGGSLMYKSVGDGYSLQLEEASGEKLGCWQVNENSGG